MKRPLLGSNRRLKSHETVQVFDESRLQSLNTEVSNQGAEFKIRLPNTEVSNQATNVSNQGQMPGFGSARIEKSIL